MPASIQIPRDDVNQMRKVREALDCGRFKALRRQLAADRARDV